ncbi:MAG: response regulator [Verrucomicrobiaceae bacterium]|nr:response regulator [Verrucomicrobiaceae bacterium]
MNSLRLRILIQMTAIGLLPCTAMVLGLRFLPGGLLPWLLYGVLVLLICVTAIARAGSISRPLKEALDAMGMLMRSAGTYKPKAWVPKEYWAMQDSLSRVLAEEREQRIVLEKQLAAQGKAVAEAEAAAMRGIEVLHAIVEAASEGIVFIHAEGHLAMINHRALDLFQLTDEVARPGVGNTIWLNAVAAKFKEADNLTTIWQAWQSGPGIQEGEWTTLTGRTITIRTFDVRQEQGTLLGRIWMFQDVTELRQMSQRLQESQKMESIGQLAGGIAHDFNNLLTAIRGNLTLAELQDNNDGFRGKIDDANRAAGRAAELVNQILGYSRKSRHERNTCDISHVIDDVRNILRASLDPKVTLRCNVPKNLWQTVGAPVQIEQVLLNLCLNARDALPDAGGTIDISTLNIAETLSLGEGSGHRGDYVVIKVKDNGHGVPLEARSHIFEPFFTTKDQGKGTGLGLSMAKSIIEQAGGWMEFDSELGKGTEFRVFLPREVRPIAKTSKSAEPAPARPARGSAEGTVLVVDDEAPVRSIAVNMLKYLGYSVVEAQDGEEAIRILQNNGKPIDAIMMDVYMPKLSGRDTFKQIRSLGIDVPVIVCSGFMIDAEEFTSLCTSQQGPVEVIQKPYSMESLARVVRKAIVEGHRALSA